MINLWIGNAFPVDPIYDLGNYTFYSLIFFYFYKKKFIKGYLLTLVCLLMLTPFFFNNFFIDWKLSPDQSKYFSISYNLRNNFINDFFNFDHEFRPLKVFIASYIFALAPILNIETFKSLGFLNRFLLIGTSLFFLKKRRINTSLFLITFLSPSLTYFSSISLREILIILSMIWAINFILEKKYFVFFFLFLVVLLIKPQNTLILLFFSILYFFNIAQKKFIFIFSISLFSIIFLSFFYDQIYQSFDLARRGLFYEQYGAYKGITAKNIYESIKFDLSSLIVVVDSLFYFITSPLFNMSTKIRYLVFLETVLLYVYFFKEILKNKKSQIVIISFIWILIAIFSFIIYSLVLFNDGTIHRMRIGLIFFIFYGYNLHKNKFLSEKKLSMQNE